jgi:hypothetical protein
MKYISLDKQHKIKLQNGITSPRFYNNGHNGSQLGNQWTPIVRVASLTMPMTSLGRFLRITCVKSKKK